MRPSTLRWRVYVLVGAVLALLLMTVASTSLARLRVGDYNSTLRYTLRPPEASSAAQAKAYVDMETVERGYLLTRAGRLLEPYYTGQRRGNGRRTERLRPHASRRPHRVEAAGVRWTAAAADCERNVADARGDGA